MNVGGAHLNGVFEECLEKTGHGRVTERLRLKVREIEIPAGEVRSDFLGQRTDFVRVPVKEIQGAQEIGLANQDGLDRAAELQTDGVVGLEIRRIGESHTESPLRGLVQNECAMPAGEGFRKERAEFGTQTQLSEIDEGQMQLFGEELQEILLAHVTEIDQDPAKFLPASSLLGESFVERRLREEVGAEEKFSQAQALAVGIKGGGVHRGGDGERRRRCSWRR
jgi:hypothetical protein